VTCYVNSKLRVIFEQFVSCHHSYINIVLWIVCCCDNREIYFEFQSNLINFISFLSIAVFYGIKLYLVLVYGTILTENKQRRIEINWNLRTRVQQFLFDMQCSLVCVQSTRLVLHFV
jgi:hypothetical protein